MEESAYGHAVAAEVGHEPHAGENDEHWAPAYNRAQVIFDAKRISFILIPICIVS